MAALHEDPAGRVLFETREVLGKKSVHLLEVRPGGNIAERHHRVVLLKNLLVGRATEQLRLANIGRLAL